MLGPFATTSRLTPIQQMSIAVLSRAACASMSTTTSTTTTRDRGDHYGPMEWAQLVLSVNYAAWSTGVVVTLSMSAHCMPCLPLYSRGSRCGEVR